mgnify:CR=1 FL=1
MTEPFDLRRVLVRLEEEMNPDRLHDLAVAACQEVERLQVENTDLRRIDQGVEDDTTVEIEIVRDEGDGLRSLSLDQWKEAIIDACRVAGIYRHTHETNPAQAVNDLLVWQQNLGHGHRGAGVRR